jgi:putative phage-type endonuclease
MKVKRFGEGVTETIFDSREEWLENRTKGIGGSEASAIIGQNPYLTNDELWKIKTGRKERQDISNQPYVVYGQKAETHIRSLFKLDYPDMKVYYNANNSFYNEKYPFALASLDGWMKDPDGRLGILEIKTSNIVSSMAKESWKDRLPMNYYCQVLWYMGVLDADFACLTANLKYQYDRKGIDLKTVTRHYWIERKDADEDIQYLFKKAAEFWECVEKDKEPGLIIPGI